MSLPYETNPLPMRRTNRERPLPAKDMTNSASTATRGPGYRPVPNQQRTALRQTTSVYGTVKPARSLPTFFLIVTLLLTISILVLSIVFDMPIIDRLRSALFNSMPVKAPTSTLSKQAVVSLNAFGLSLFAKLAGKDDQKNVVLSPASVASSLSMVAAGATQGSETAKQLEGLLGARFASPAGESDPAVTLAVANAAWVTGSVLESFKVDVKKAFGADVFPAPKDAAVINNWVSKVTRGNIPTIMDSVPSPLVALLVNAVFFKASWKTSFGQRDTVDAPFFGPHGEEAGAEPVTTVRMMKQFKKSFQYAEVPVKGRREIVQVVELKYGTKEEYAAVVVVPSGQMTVTDVTNLFKEGDTSVWDGWVNRLNSRKLDTLAMPRFKVEYGVQSLKQSLQQIGIDAPFTSGRTNPQLMRMSSDKDAYLDDVLHKATLECTEEGTVASAAAVSVVMSRSMPREEPSVILNRPFLFAIRNTVSGAILFMARVDNPVSP